MFVNICSKIYNYIINKRLSKWVGVEDILGEIQAAFRKDHSTVDHIVLLFCNNREIFTEKLKKWHVVLIDFRKAFDLISYNKLWPILCKCGLKTKMVQTIQSMYKIVKARVRNGQTCFSLPERPQAGGSK